MRTPRLALLAALLALPLSAASLHASGGPLPPEEDGVVADETEVADYVDHADAVRRGAVRRGRVPGFVPRSATRIHAVRDLDTEEAWLRFGAPEAALRAMVNGMEAMPVARARRESTPRPRDVGAWPRELERRPGPAPREPRLFTVHRKPARGQDEQWCVAVEWAGRAAYAWTC